MTGFEEYFFAKLWLVLPVWLTVYHVDYETAQGLRAVQWLEWTGDEDV